ncbi:MAG: MltA domain-containing protein [Thermoanaerobaculia bacterium]
MTPTEPGQRWRWIALAALAACLALAGLWLLALRANRLLEAELARASAVQASAPPPAPPPPPPELRLEAASFAQLPGWAEDSLAEALPALEASCSMILKLPESRGIGPHQLAGRARDWRGPCKALAALHPGQDAALRSLLESRFRAYRLSNREEPQGLFTGYYEPSLRGSLKPTPTYATPLYLRPRDLLVADLGRFKPELAGRKILGRVAGGELVPYFDRAEIDAGALAGKHLEMVWVDDPVAAFFLHIQGSGRVELPGGKTLRVGYAGQNGHAYVAIGKVLLERGELKREEVSLQSIRRWLADHPAEARDLLAENPSYVFFQKLAGGPVGSEGVELTAGRSLAVDLAFLPLGVPLWLAASRPSVDPSQPDLPLQRLLVAQDTGGAITGPLRGDVFWGHGAEAEEIAGRMKNRGRLWLLLPADVVPPAAVPAAANPGR